MGKFRLEHLTDEEATRGWFWILLLVAEISLFASFILVALFFGEYKGGLNWNDNNFNFHPLFMVFGFIFIYGHSMLAFKVLQACPSLAIKLVHSLVNVVAFIFIVIGMNCAFEHNTSHLYSLHSWLGFITLLLFCLQWVAGFLILLFPGLSTFAKGIYKPLHVFWGISVFCLAVASVLTGTMEEVGHLDGYMDHNAEGLLVNFMALMTVVAAATISYIVTNKDFIFHPKLTEEQIPIN